MFAVLKRSPLAVLMAIVLHILLGLYLIFGLDWSSSPKQVIPKADVVQARVVDVSKVESELAKLKKAEEAKQAAKAAVLRQEQKRLEELKRKQAVEKKRLVELEQQRRVKQAEEKKRSEAARKKQQAEAKRKAEAEAKHKAEAEAKRKSEAEAKRKAEAEAKRKAEAEAKRKAEAEAKQKAEAKRKAEAEAKRKAAAVQVAREKALQDQLVAEQNAREIDRYVAVIKQQVERSWLRPTNAGQGLSCIVQVRLIPGGDVVPGGVSIIQSSGNATFDRSVETAVYKAAPLPVPSGNLFESFRNLRLNFKPSEK